MKTKVTLTITLIILSFCSLAQISEAIKVRVIDPNGNSDESIIRLKDEATPSFDSQWDAWKLFSPNEANPNIYSNTDDQLPLAINAIPTMTKDTIINLYIRAKQTSGTYTIETEQLGALPTNVKMAIKDVETGDTYKLNQNITHSFTIQADPNNDIFRFELFYSRLATVSTSDDDITITNDGCTNWDYLIKDEYDQTVYDENNLSESVELNNLQDGIYTLYVTDTYGLTDTLTFEIDQAGDDDPVNTASINNHSLENLTAYAANSNIYFNGKNFNEQVAIHIYNINGQLIYSISSVVISSEFSMQPPIDSQFILVSVSTQESAKTFKLFF